MPDLGSVRLPVPTTVAGVEGLQAILADPIRALVVLDFDGTLAPIVMEPALARAHPDASSTMRRLAATIGTVAVVTGRPSEVAASLLGFTAEAPPANVFVVGHYGLETWTPSAGVVRVAGADLSQLEGVRSALPDLLRDLGAPHGTVIEDKGAAVAVHVRGADQPREALELLRAPLAHLAAVHGLRFEPGRLVLELRPRGTDKGTALVSLVRAQAALSVCYIGDDLGDLAAFDALVELRSAGLAALGVFSGAASEPEVAEVAARTDLVLAGPPEVVGFLDALCRGVRFGKSA